MPPVDVLVVGGGLGGCAAALAAARKGLSVVLAESSDWVGGQLTSQGVPPDEHPWIETCGCSASYRALRDAMRAECRARYPLTPGACADEALNPGEAWVSKLSCEPRIALAALEQLLAPAIDSGHLVVHLEHELAAAATDGDRVTGATFRRRDGTSVAVNARFVLDATELGELLALAGVEHVTGAESRAETGEEHAPLKAAPRNTQAVTVCFAVEHREGENHTIQRPLRYEFWRSYAPAQMSPPWPGRLLSLQYTHPVTLEPVDPLFVPHDDTLDPSHPNLWSYRRIISRRIMAAASPAAAGGLISGVAGSATDDIDAAASDVCLINWPQNDYWIQDLCLATPQELEQHVEDARQLSLSLLCAR